MKLFNSQPAVSFHEGQIVLGDLAYNHPYRRENDQLVIEGNDAETLQEYKVYYSLEGIVQLVVLKKRSNARVRPSWKQETENHEVQKIKANGDLFYAEKSYLPTSEGFKLVRKRFLIQWKKKQETVIFSLENGRWTRKGEISAAFKLAWLGI